MSRRPQRSTLTDTLFPTRRSSDLRSKDGVEWVLSAIPLGGYVKMLDEREGEVAAAELPYAFTRASVGKRMLIVAAGPLFNFALARSEEHTSELQSLMRISYAVFCLKKKMNKTRM